LYQVLALDAPVVPALDPPELSREEQRERLARCRALIEAKRPLP
jgi:hypothetical protein